MVPAPMTAIVFKLSFASIRISRFKHFHPGSSQPRSTRFSILDCHHRSPACS
jgi:hypothetical protein